MSRKKLVGLCIMIFLCFLFLLRVAQSSQSASHNNNCPRDMIIQAQSCFSEFARAVHPAYRRGTRRRSHLPARTGEEDEAEGPGSVEGSLILDYSQIKKYCARDGHITKFVRCIEEIVTRCENSPQAALVERLLSPERVRKAVPTLCKHQNEVDASSACLTMVMRTKSECRENAYKKVKSLMAQAATNATAMFLTQCRFFHSLAECQRDAVSQHCGSSLGDLHANFLLSFVPKLCSRSDNNIISPRSPNTVTADTTQELGSIIPKHKSSKGILTRPHSTRKHGEGVNNSGNNVYSYNHAFHVRIYFALVSLLCSRYSSLYFTM